MKHNSFLAVAVGLTMLAAAPSADAQEKKADKKSSEANRSETSSSPGTTTTTAANPLERGEFGNTREPNRLLLIGGAATFGVPYVASALVGMTSDRESDKHLFIPIAGPWIALGDRDCDERECNARLFTGALMVADGLLQTAGAFAVAASFFIPERATPLNIGTGTTKVTLVPSKLGPHGYGLMTVGQF